MRWGVVEGRAQETEKLHVEQGEEGGESPTSFGDGEATQWWIMVMLDDSGWWAVAGGHAERVKRNSMRNGLKAALTEERRQ
jgi:hypothetical protein